MKQLLKNGSAGAIILVKLVDATSGTGAGKTGLVAGSDGLRIASKADVEATSVACTGSNIEIPTSPIGTYQAPSGSDKCRFREIDAVNHPGIYEVFLPAARFAVSGARSLLVSISATETTQADLEYQLTAGLDVNDGVRGGMTALPNVASGAAGSIPTTGTGANQIQVNGSGAIASVVSVAACQDLLEADRVIDTSVTPWALVLIKKGSGALGQPGTVELLRQKLRDVAGGAIVNISTVLGQSIT
jgi:hypothetical protein